MDIEAQKETLISKLKRINDINLIHAINSLLDYASERDAEVYTIPEEHQNLVMERFEKAGKNPKELVDWEEAKKKLKS